MFVQGTLSLAQQRSVVNERFYDMYLGTIPGYTVGTQSQGMTKTKETGLPACHFFQTFRANSHLHRFQRVYLLQLG